MIMPRMFLPSRMSWYPRLMSQLANSSRLACNKFTEREEAPQSALTA
jgi:hypothetical protein